MKAVVESTQSDSLIFTSLIQFCVSANANLSIHQWHIHQSQCINEQSTSKFHYYWLIKHWWYPLVRRQHKCSLPNGRDILYMQPNLKKKTKKKNRHTIIGISVTKILLIGWSLIMCLFRKGKTNQTIRTLFSSKMHNNSYNRCVRAKEETFLLKNRK